MNDFIGFPKIARLKREVIVTEKIDGTNAQIRITDAGEFLIGSRNRWITPDNDNYGFARWAYENKEELMRLGIGAHFGEWWGQGIQRTYGMKEKRFSLFNVTRWNDDELRPKCCDVVPVLYQGFFSTNAIDECVNKLREFGSIAAPGFMRPEGIVTFCTANNVCFKTTLENDETPKSKNDVRED